MALPAGRKGVLASELTPSGRIKKTYVPVPTPSPTPTNPVSFTVYDTPSSEDFTECYIVCADFGDWCLVTGWFTVASSVTGGWTSLVTLPANKTGITLTASGGYMTSGFAGCDMVIDSNLTGILNAFLGSGHANHRYSFTTIYEKKG